MDSNDDEIDHVYFDSFQILCERKKVWPKAVDRSLKPKKLNEGPKTLVCHDMKGGYLAEDKLATIEAKNLETMPFIFTYWWYIDMFVYFSHHFITVPTVRWINQCHDHDVFCLGTLITECEGGRNLCKEIFSKEKNVDILIDHLVCLCEEFHFDGWLINIENIIDKELIDMLILFLYKLKNSLKKRIGKQSQLVWYDSVCIDGSLKWQDELNSKNVSFAEVVDAFYVNYGWKHDHLKRTRNYLQTEKISIPLTSVYFGVDVFGRGSFGGGQFNSHVGVQAARNAGFSVAIFAPGWTTECFANTRECVSNHDKLFRQMTHILYPHRISRSFKTNFSIGFSDLKFDPSTRTIFSFLLESKKFKLNSEGLIIKGKRESRHVLFLTDFRCVHSYKIEYNCPDKLVINVNTISDSNTPNQMDFINIWDIYCVKLTDEPVLLNYLSFSVQY